MNPSPSLRPSRNREAGLFVWSIWMLMLAAALWYVARWAVPYPFGDEWQHVRALAGIQPFSPGWLRAQNGWSHEDGNVYCRQEHRLVIYRLAVYALGKLGIHDLRVLAFPVILLLGGVAATLIVAARRLRGETAFSDAFFPLVILHWGHPMNHLWALTALTFTVPGATVGLLLTVCAQAKEPFSSRTSCAYAGGLVVLFLCGSTGLAFVPLLSLVLGYSALLHLRAPAPERKRTGWLSLGLALGCVGLFGLNFVGYEPPDSEDYFPFHGFHVFLLTALRFLTLGLAAGRPLVHVQPYVGWAVAGLLIVSAVVLAFLWRRRPNERFRAFSLLCFPASVLGLAAVLGWTRQLHPDDPEYANFGAGYYDMLAVPGVLWAYLVWTVYPVPGGRFIQVSLFGLCCVLLHVNMREGYAFGKWYRGVMTSFEDDLNGQMSPSLVAERQWTAVGGGLPVEIGQEYFTWALNTLRAAEVEPYNRLLDDAAVREERVALTPAELHGVAWEGTTAEVTLDTPVLTFAVSPPRLVLGIRLKYFVHDTPCYALDLSCRRSGEQEYSPASMPPDFSLDPGADRALTVRVGERIDAFLIALDKKPCRITFREIVLLVPASSATTGR